MKPKNNETGQVPVTEPWVNTSAACHHLGISKPTIHRWIKAERLKAKRLPTGEYRFRVSELDRVLD